MNAKPTYHHFCTIMRRKLVKHYDGFENAGKGIVAKEEWVTEPCGVPIFEDVGHATGECRSCRSGWTHEHNYRADETTDPSSSVDAASDQARDDALLRMGE